MSTPPSSLQLGNGTLVGRILVVDDERYVLSYFMRTLTARGHEVIPASSAPEALEELQRGAIDLVISDVSMPGMDGVGLLQAVRQLDPDLPLILISGNPELSSALSAVEHGALRYLTKPVRDAELHAVVQEGLKLRTDTRRMRLALELINQTKPNSPQAHANLDEALSTMWMAYQPIFRAADGKVFAHEALLRSQSAVLSNPGLVLDTAEDLGRTQDVGQRVRHLVSGLLATRATEYLFVNVHAEELLDESLYNPDSPLSRMARRVVLEITERAALDGVNDVRGRTRRLRELGFGLAVDDLGAGYAGLNSFAQIGPDFVKLDISLVRDVHRDRLKHKLVQGLMSVCKDMGVTVVAEGVETAEERDALVEMGCDLLQGFLLGRPSANLLS